MEALEFESMLNAITNGENQSKDLIYHFVEGVTTDSIDETHIIKWLKTMHKFGCTNEDVVQLTTAMRMSGATLEWNEGKPVVDKHSTGGVGDKMSIMLAPALAACGVRVPMLAGRSLGHTGGTIDKLESIPHFSCHQTPEDMVRIVEEVGCCIVAQNPSIAPADGRLYALRDVTNTIDNIQLITASILSKKSAEGLDALVLDVKFGSAAFMKTVDDAVALARSMVAVGNGSGIKTIAQITQMDNPIGSHIGNSLEILESIEVLQGRGHQDTIDLVALQGGALLHLTNIAESEEKGQDMIRSVLKNGEARDAFLSMCIAQGVPHHFAERLVSDPQSILPAPKHTTQFFAKESGYVTHFLTLEIAEQLRRMGAGRMHLDDIIDPTIGIIIENHIAEQVSIGDPVLTLHHSTPLTNEEQAFFSTCFEIQPEPITTLPRLHMTIT